MSRWSGAARGAAVAALVVALPLAGCGSGSEEPSPSPRTTPPPTGSSSPAPGPRAPVVTPPARPSDFDTAPSEPGITYRSYLGAAVPGGRAGPRSQAAGTASGWSRSAAGAVLAAAHFAVALDARQPRTLWTPVVRTAEPRSRVKATLARANRAAATWDAKLAADEKARTQEPEDGDAGRIPPAIWVPTIRVVAYTGLRVSAKRATVTVWSRSSGTARWRSRPLTLQWTRADWRVRLPLPRPWRTQDPPAGLRPISDLSG